MSSRYPFAVLFGTLGGGFYAFIPNLFIESDEFDTCLTLREMSDGKKRYI